MFYVLQENLYQLPFLFLLQQDGTRGEVCSGITVTTTEGKYGTAIRRSEYK